MRPVDNRLDVVAIRIHYESGVVTGMIIPRPRFAIVLAAGRDTRLVETPNARLVIGAEGDMRNGRWLFRGSRLR